MRTNKHQTYAEWVKKEAEDARDDQRAENYARFHEATDEEIRLEAERRERTGDKGGFVNGVYYPG